MAQGVPPPPGSSAPAAGRALGSDLPLACAAGLVYFVLALVPVAGLTARGWKQSLGTEVAEVPWGDVGVLFGGTIAAIAAARAIAFSPSLRALRAAFLAHGAAAMATAAMCAVLLAWFPQAPRRGAAPDTSPGMLYVRAVDPFFLPQLALGLGAALAFRGLTARTRGERAGQRSPAVADESPSASMLAALSVTCYLAMFAYAHAEPSNDVWRLLDPHAHRVLRVGFITLATPVLLGMLAAAASAPAIARSSLVVATALGLGVHLAAAAASQALAFLTWLAFQYAESHRTGWAALDVLHNTTLLVKSYGPSGAGTPVGVLLQSVTGAVAALAFWVVVPRRAAAPVMRSTLPAAASLPEHHLSSNDAPLVCASAALFAVPALVSSLATMGDRGPEHRFSALSTIAWVHLCLVVGGTLAAAAVARRLAFQPSRRRALGAALLAHGAAVLVTVGFCAILVASLPPDAAVGVTFRLQARDGRSHAETFEAPLARSAGDFALRHLFIGMAAALAFRRLTEGSRLRHAAWPAETRARRDSGWPRERTLAAFGAASFLLVSAAFLYPFVHFDAVPSSAREATFTVLLAIPILTGTLAAAASASAIAKSRLVSVTAGAVHLLAAMGTLGIVTIAVMATTPMERPGSVDFEKLLAAPVVVLYYFFPYVVGVVVAQTTAGIVAALVFAGGLAAFSAIRRSGPPDRRDGPR